MGRKCCVPLCRSKYDLNDKTPTFRLPHDVTEKQRWLKAIPREYTPDTKNTVVCERHWPIGYEKLKVRGKERPVSPPTVFESIPPSVIPTPQPKPRTTTRVLASIRSVQEDESKQFEESDKIILENFFDEVKTRSFNDVPVVSYQVDKTVCI